MECLIKTGQHKGVIPFQLVKGAVSCMFCGQVYEPSKLTKDITSCRNNNCESHKYEFLVKANT